MARMDYPGTCDVDHISCPFCGGSDWDTICVTDTDYDDSTEGPIYLETSTLTCNSCRMSCHMTEVYTRTKIVLTWWGKEGSEDMTASD